MIAIDTPDGLRRSAFGGDLVDLRTTEPIQYEHLMFLSRQPFVLGDVRRLEERLVRLVVDEASTAVPQLLERCKEIDCTIESIEEYLPPFDDVFVEIVKKEPANG
jgi:hypothetical protein